MASEFRKNVPHIIAIFLLLFALLIVSTKVGLIRCSDLGEGYCQVYWGIFGTPKILIVYGDEGIGDPSKLESEIETIWRLPVQKIDVNSISEEMLFRYDLVIVERARQIPTAKMKIFNDYMMKKLDGRLVWVGDSGTFGSLSDKSCRDMEFTVRYTEKIWNTSTLQAASRTKMVCIDEGALDRENISLFENTALRAKLLKEAAFNKLKEYCTDSFSTTQDAKLDLVKEKYGYRCNLPSNSDYSQVFFDWQNEGKFNNIINPWDRGNYTLLGTERMGEGVDFGTNVLGLSFVADEFAVKNYQDYETRLEEARQELLVANTGFLACSDLMSGSVCDTSKTLGKIKTDLAEIKELKTSTQDYIDYSVITQLTSTLKSSGNSSASLSDAIYIIQAEREKLGDIVVPGNEPSEQDITQMQSIKDSLESMIGPISSLEASEDDETMQNEYAEMRVYLENKKNRLDDYLNNLTVDMNEHEQCKEHGGGTIQGGLMAELGEENHNKIDLLLSYSSRQTTKIGVLSFMAQTTDDQGLTPEWKHFQVKLNSTDVESVCKGKSDKAEEGFKAAVKALKIMEEVSMEEVKWDARATLKILDQDHLLARGISPSVPLEYTIGNKTLPVPFMLVGALDSPANIVARLEVVPKYADRQDWPAITTHEPIFKTQSMGKGTVVYYAFPPETEEELVHNMIEFLLY